MPPQSPLLPAYEATSLEAIARAPDIPTLEAFVAAAGYTDASVVHDLPDPKFVSGGWATSRLTVSPDEPFQW